MVDYLLSEPIQNNLASYLEKVKKHSSKKLDIAIDIVPDEPKA